MSNNITFSVGNQNFEIRQRPHFKFDLLEDGNVRAANLTVGELFQKLQGAVTMITDLNRMNGDAHTNYEKIVAELEKTVDELKQGYPNVWLWRIASAILAGLASLQLF
jgi:hypothetical protein